MMTRQRVSDRQEKQRLHFGTMILYLVGSDAAKRTSLRHASHYERLLVTACTTSIACIGNPATNILARTSSFKPKRDKSS